MTDIAAPTLDFGDAARTDAAMSARARGLIGSEILKIASEIRQLVAAGRTVCNLTVGDFDARHFPIPEGLREAVERAFQRGETNYPPSDGLLALRKAVVTKIARDWGVTYPVESVIIAGGARPILYAAYRCVLDPGDAVLYGVPSWNNNHYSWIAGARPIEVIARAESGFQPTLEQIAPHLGEVQMICLCTPSNPTGTVMEPERLQAILEAVVEENAKRTRAGRRHVMVVFDQVYASLVFGSARHVHPAALVPRSAPYVIALDAISKAYAATGLRIGWTMAPPAVAARMRDFLGHVGAWAPRPEQVAMAEFLSDEAAEAAFHREMCARVSQRLDALYEGFQRLKAEGFPVDCVPPQGAIYLSLRLDLVGRTLDGRTVADNEAIRQILLDQAGLAVVPFQAFGLREDTGWFRISVGAVGLDDIENAFPRVRALLQRVGAAPAVPAS